MRKRKLLMLRVEAETIFYCIFQRKNVHCIYLHFFLFAYLSSIWHRCHGHPKHCGGGAMFAQPIRRDNRFTLSASHHRTLQLSSRNACFCFCYFQILYAAEKHDSLAAMNPQRRGCARVSSLSPPRAASLAFCCAASLYSLVAVHVIHNVRKRLRSVNLL